MNQPPFSLLLRASLLALLSNIAACSGLLNSDRPAEKTYWLEPFTVPQTNIADSVRKSIAVTVTAAPGLDTDRLLILGSGARLNYYEAARWPDNSPEVIQSLLRTTLESTGRYSNVTAGRTSYSTDWALNLEVRELYSRSNSSEDMQDVRIALSGTVMCSGPDFTVTLGSDVAIENNRLSDVVAAYQQGLREVSQQLLTRMDETCDSTSAVSN